MAHKLKVGDRVLLGRHKHNENFIDYMGPFVGREAILLAKYNTGFKFNPPSWYVRLASETERLGCYWHEDVMVLLSCCPCGVKTCLKHRVINGRSQ